MKNQLTDIKDRKDWDCIVIGAGPAGTLLAYQIAKENKNVLLVDKANFPRAKVCGCCINGSALDVLQSVGLENILAENGAHKLNGLRLFNNKKWADLSFPRGFSLSREKFDMALTNAAIDCGANVLFKANATVLSLEPLPIVQIQQEGLKYNLQAKIVIIADGLSGSSLELLSQFEPKINKDSKFGASVILDQIPSYIETGKIYMACGNGGYVGMVALEDGRLNVAAALSYIFCRQFNGPGAAAAHLLNSNALPVPKQLTQARWTGTSLLTRNRPQIAGHRLFIVGDACGYTEPFTGEGMAWALWSGLSGSKLVIEAINDWNPNLVTKWHQVQNQLNMRRTRSQIIALALRNDWLRNIFVTLSSALPMVSSPLVQIISGTKINASYDSRG